MTNADAFGNAANIDEDPDNDSTDLVFNLRFPGQYFDSETGLHYNHFRDYDPKTGRYMESDPIGLDGGLNIYLYTNANPIKSIDPEGMQAVIPWWPILPPPPGGVTPLPSIPRLEPPLGCLISPILCMVKDDSNVIPFPGASDGPKDCPNDPLCHNTMQARLYTISWNSPEHDGFSMPGLSMWQCEYTCPNGSKFTKYLPSRLGCPQSLPPR